MSTGEQTETKGANRKFKVFREWTTFGIALLGAILGTLSYFHSRETAREAYQNTAAITRIEVQKLLDSAWDKLGGAEGTSIIMAKTINSNVLELAHREIEQAMILAPTSSRAYRILAAYYEARQLNEKAEKAYIKAIELEPKLSIPIQQLRRLPIKAKKVEGIRRGHSKCYKVKSKIRSCLQQFR